MGRQDDSPPGDTPVLPHSRTPPLPKPASQRSTFTPRLWAAIKWGLFALVLYFVGRHAHRLWGELDAHPMRLRWGWLAMAAVASVVAWLPSLWFWRRLLLVLGWRPPRLELARAYYCSHPAKYVPGKALVILLRATFLQACGVPAATTAYTVTLETLTYMAAGVVTTALLLPAIVAGVPQLRELAAIAEQPMWRVGTFVVALLVSLCGLAVLSRMSVYFAGRIKGAVPAVGSLDQPIPLPTFARGLGLFLGAWWLQGATLGLTIQALSPEPVDWSQWPHWTGAAAVSMVGGFLAVFAPGGLGVREGLLMELLRQQVGPHEAVAAAVLWRAVTLVGELLMAGILWTFVRPTTSDRSPPPERTLV